MMPNLRRNIVVLLSIVGFAAVVGCRPARFGIAGNQEGATTGGNVPGQGTNTGGNPGTDDSIGQVPNQDNQQGGDGSTPGGGNGSGGGGGTSGGGAGTGGSGGTSVGGSGGSGSGGSGGSGGAGTGSGSSGSDDGGKGGSGSLQPMDSKFLTQSDPRLPLTQYPQVGSLEVFADSVKITSNWTYNVSDNSVRVAPAIIPPAGKNFSVKYIAAN